MTHNTGERLGRGLARAAGVAVIAAALGAAALAHAGSETPAGTPTATKSVSAASVAPTATVSSATEGAASASATSGSGTTTPSSTTAPKTKSASKRAAKAPKMTPLKMSKSVSSSDSTMTLPGGQSGTEFKSMTIEGEDRVHIDFGRPTLQLDLDPENVPGLTRGTAMDVLDRTSPDLVTPMVAMSSDSRSPYTGHPWLSQFATGPVAHFQPAVKGVQQWKLIVADSRGQTVMIFEGKSDPPKDIAWDGHTKSGAFVTPGLTYSYVFEARDRAGNKRNFVGQGFTISAYRVDSPTGPTLVLSGRDLASADRNASAYGPSMGSRNREVPPILLEVASWLNQSPKSREPIRVAVAARTMDHASALAGRAVSALSGRVVGDPGRVQAVTEVAADAPEDGVLRIGIAK